MKDSIHVTYKSVGGIVLKQIKPKDLQIHMGCRNWGKKRLHN